ncbi:MAG: hypothetical protein ABI036_07785 [Fibrobacteria bacterium]
MRLGKLFQLGIVWLACTVNADNLLDAHYQFNSYNAYSPNVMKDGAIYRMWYGGWQASSDYPNDKIYYRYSSDNISWSTVQTVLTPGQVSTSAQHVNDPSVTKHFNVTSGTYQYTMFYTVCVSPCNQSDNQIWSSVSSDGVTWAFPQMLAIGGPAEPSAIYDPSSDGTYWKVYYVDRNALDKVRMLKVNGNRNAIISQDVYSNSNFAMANPEVQYFNGSWQLFFNVWKQSPLRMDIYKVTSGNNTSWPANTSTGIILNTTNPGGICMTATPGILPDPSISNRYHMYFAVQFAPSGGYCTSPISFVETDRWYMSN